MGIIVFIVFAGYMLVCAVIFAVVAYSIPKNSGRKKTAAKLGFTLFLMAWPVWVTLGSKALFETACHFGNGGMHRTKPFQIDTFTFGNRSAGYYYARREWKGKNDFLSSCDEYCVKELNYIFSESNPWFAIRDTGMAIEESWLFQDSPNRTPERLRHGRLWVTASGSSDCIAALTSAKTNSATEKCIAGKEIPTISAPFVVEIYPFKQPVHYGSSGGWKKMPSSMEWKWFSVSKHQSQLLRNGELVANYVWYDWDFLPFFGLRGSCPDESIPTHVGDRIFWQKLFSNGS